jgi:hypothetical protein
MTFRSKHPPRPVKQYEGANVGTPRPTVARHPESALALLDDLEVVEMPVGLRRVAPYTPPRDPAVAQGNKIRDSARGEACTVRLIGVCSFDPERTIWSHARWGAQLCDAGRGMATKALDLCGAYACTDCDAVYDGQRAAPHLTREQIDLDWCLGHFRSIGRLSLKGLL